MLAGAGGVADAREGAGGYGRVIGGRRGLRRVQRAPEGARAQGGCGVPVQGARM